ncbi:MAG: hypothetical protein ACF8QF_08500 [Phycisphaerales bacterium]
MRLPVLEGAPAASHATVFDLTDAQRGAIACVAPATPAQLHAWLRIVLGLAIPRRAVAPGSSAPFDYLCHAYFEDRAGPQDCVVWAARGSGKTFLAAVATLLDLLHKPGVEVRLLGGSLEQSRRVQAHLRGFFERPHLAALVAGRITEKRIALVNGSACEILAQSHTSVRGAHPHILRCDEAELFDPEVWRAAQLVPRSQTLANGLWVQGRVETFSTMHRPGGLMEELVADATGTRRVFRWGVLDALATCASERPCESCDLEPECAGRAKQASGHIAVEDAIALKRRASAASWASEMLCERPTRDDAVYPEFEVGVHVAPFDAGERWRWLCGMDFGFRAPTVILWGAVDAGGVLRIVDERIARQRTLDRHIEAIRRSRWPAPAWIGVDPAGRQRSDQTGLSAVALLRRAGFVVRDRRETLAAGLGAVRARLAPATGAPTLFIHPRCRGLIESLQRYRYPDARPDDELPLKDGADHAADALRYLVVNLDLRRGVEVRRYV